MEKVYMNSGGQKYLAMSPSVLGDAEVPYVSQTLREILSVAPRPLSQAEIDEAVLAWPDRDKEKLP